MDKRKYRILMFAPAFAPFANPEAIVNNKLALAMIRKGWHVDIITRSDNELSNYNYGSAWENIWIPLRSSTYPIKYNSLSSLRKLTDTVRSAIRTGYPATGCRWAAHAFNLALDLHRNNNYNVIISRALPDPAHLSALLFKKETHVPWIANWNDPPLFLFPPEHNIKLSKPIQFFNDKLVRTVIENANILTFSSSRLKELLSEKYKQKCSKMSIVIPHAALFASFETQKPTDKFTLCHAGNLYPERDPENFFKGLSLFLKKNKDAPLRFVNIGIESEKVKKMVNIFNLSKYCHFLGKKSYMETIDHLSQSDVLIVIEGRYKQSIFLPSKVADYVQTGKPLLSISPPDSEINDIIKQYGGGIVADCFSPEAIADALCSFYNQWKEGSFEIKYDAKNLYSFFSPDKIISQYEKIFMQIHIKK